MSTIPVCNLAKDMTLHIPCLYLQREKIKRNPTVFACNSRHIQPLLHRRLQ